MFGFNTGCVVWRSCVRVRRNGDPPQYYLIRSLAQAKLVEQELARAGWGTGRDQPLFGLEINSVDGFQGTTRCARKQVCHKRALAKLRKPELNLKQ